MTDLLLFDHTKDTTFAARMLSQLWEVELLERLGEILHCDETAY